METTQATVEVVKTAQKAAVKPVAKPKAKAATKPAVKAAESKAKPAAKAKPATASKSKPKAVSGLQFHLMAGVARPGSGASLYAHTRAVLELTGMDKGKKVAVSILRKVMGETGVRYNVKEGKFAQDAEGFVTLTAGGKIALLESRKGKIDDAMVEGYKAIMTTGKADGKLVKMQDAIVKIA